MNRTRPIIDIFTVPFRVMGLAMLVCLTGCVIPTPPMDSGFTRTNINEQAVKQFTPHQTTEEDVILKLGEPDTVSADEHELVYRSETLCAFWFIPSEPVVLGGPIYDHRYFVLTFNNPGEFQNVTRTNEQPKILPDWHQAVLKQLSAPGRSNPVQIVMNRSGYWLPDVNGFSDGINPTIGGALGYLFLTESNLVFVSESDFAEPRPDLNLPLTSISRVYMDRYLLSRLLVVQTTDGAFHSFRIWGTIGGQDAPAMKAACAFIQSKITSDQSAK